MIDSNQFEQFKNDLSDKDPLVKRVRLTDIVLTEHSITNSTIEIGGVRVPVAQRFFNRLGQMVNLNSALINRMSKNEDNEVALKLLQAVKAYSEGRDGGQEYLLIGDSVKHQITNIVKADRYNRLSNITLFNTAETIMNEVPDMHIQSVDISGLGFVSINMLHGHQMDYSMIGPDETFRFGLSLVNSDGGSGIDDYFYRLICENGGAGRIDGGIRGSGGPSGFRFGGGQDGFRNLLDRLQNWARTGFVPSNFEDRLQKAISTRASYFEVEMALKAITTSITEPDIDRKQQLVKAAERQFLPEYAATSARIFRAGYNPMALTDQQKKYIKTDSNVWQLVNELTWIGSHQTEFDFKNNARFKKVGGELFTKSWDLEHAGLASI